MAITVLAAVLSLFVIAPTAGATVWVVNTTVDETDDSCAQPPVGDCSIRDALAQANAATDSVSVPPGVYNINPSFGELDVVGDTLNGAGARTTILDGGGATRVIAASDDTSTQVPISPRISGVTIRNGHAIGPSSPGNLGGGIIVLGNKVTVVNSAVTGNTADGDGGAIGMGSGPGLVLDHSTVSGNTAGANGGGIFSSSEAQEFTITNSTISGNSAARAGGGIYDGSIRALVLGNVTVAGNQSGAAPGGVRTDTPTFRNSIIYGNTGNQCVTFGTVTSNNTLAQDASCGLTGPGDITGVNPGLGPLQNNGGPTSTRAIGPSSIAFNHGGAGCQSTDQRGVTRPQLGSCDMGAFELRAARLTVVKRVVNDQGGTLGPGDFMLHVRHNFADVGGSPQPGSATGRTYVLTPGTYAVGEDADSRYTAAISGSCAANGAVALAEGQTKTCTITNDDKRPRAGKSINGAPRAGVVEVKFPGDSSFHQLTQGEQLPNNTLVDTRHGRITLFVAGKNGKVTHADFYDGLFKLRQSKKGKKLTTLTLVEKLSCKGANHAATTAAKKKRRRRLWGSGKGSFRTRGNHAAATVVGTKWLTQDTCTTTLVRVVRGKVRVLDFVKHKTVLVRKGHKYVAHAKP